MTGVVKLLHFFLTSKQSWPFFDILGHSRAVFGRFWVSWGRLGAVLGRLRAVSGCLGPFWGRLGSSGDHLGNVLGNLGASWAV